MEGLRGGTGRRSRSLLCVMSLTMVFFLGETAASEGWITLRDDNCRSCWVWVAKIPVIGCGQRPDKSAFTFDVLLSSVCSYDVCNEIFPSTLWRHAIDHGDGWVIITF